MKNIAAFQPNHPQDIYINQLGNIAISYDVEALREHIIEYMQTWLGDWILDNNYGVDYLGDVLLNPVFEDLTNTVLSFQLARVDGVISIVEASITLNPQSSIDAERVLMFNAKLETIYGIIEVGGTNANGN